MAEPDPGQTKSLIRIGLPGSIQSLPMLRTIFGLPDKGIFLDRFMMPLLRLASPGLDSQSKVFGSWQFLLVKEVSVSLTLVGPVHLVCPCLPSASFPFDDLALTHLVPGRSSLGAMDWIARCMP